MKFRVSMKDPDCLYEPINEAVMTALAKLELSQDEIDVVADKRAAKVREDCSKWFKWGEYLTVEIDTEAGTCTVIPCST
jgi:hypothetical protein